MIGTGRDARGGWAWWPRRAQGACVGAGRGAWRSGCSARGGRGSVRWQTPRRRKARAPGVGAVRWNGPMTSDRPLRLLAPDLGAQPSPRPPDQLDPGQRQVLDRIGTGADVIVHGAPGSGRTTLALSAAAAAGADGLLLSPRRSAAAWLRDGLAASGAGETAVMTPHALGYAVLRA